MKKRKKGHEEEKSIYKTYLKLICSGRSGTSFIGNFMPLV